MMELIDLVMTGAELRFDGSEALPIDAVLIGEHSTLILLSRWWTGLAQQGTHTIVLHGLPEERDGIWYFDNQHGNQIAPPSDQEMADLLTEHRAATQFNRGAYLAAIEDLSSLDSGDGEDNYDWGALKAAAVDMEARDAIAESLERRSRAREVGVAVVQDNADNLVEVAVFDEDGNTHSTRETGYLSAFTEQFAAFNDAERPDLAMYMSNISELRLHGPVVISSSNVEERTGLVEDIALQVTADRV